MELNTLFSNLNVMWTRWSEYTLVKNEISGPHIDFLVPASGAAALAFNCAEHPEDLVAEALELGRQLSGLRRKAACVPLSQPVTGFWGWRRTRTPPSMTAPKCPLSAGR